MIAYLEGNLLKKDGDRIVLKAGFIGYEILLPVVVMENISDKKIGDEVKLFIYYHQTERQPKPVLIGFNKEIERDFFQYFISVEAIGPIKAAQALCEPVRDIANAIETEDVKQLTKLKGIGKRTAQKIVATLQGKMGRFALIQDNSQKPVKVSQPARDEDIREQVLDVLINQLGHRLQEAKHLVDAALQRNKNISTAEDLFDEIYRGEKK